MQADRYLGINQELTSFYKQQGSKFYGYLFPVKDLADFELRKKQLWEKYKDATHICWATVLEQDRKFQKFSDDGEPSNSAGRPILNELLSAGISFVGCAVVRYYGGKKLGIPGLIEAYGSCAKLCIDEAKIETIVMKDSIFCKTAPEKEYLLFNYLARNKQFTYAYSDGQFEVVCSQSMTAELRSNLSKIDTLVFINE